jgi:hypothetical protein
MNEFRVPTGSIDVPDQAADRSPLYFRLSNESSRFVKDLQLLL